MRKGLHIALALIVLAATAPALASPDRPSPGMQTGSLSLEKTALTLSYSPKHKQADWVFYELGPKQLQNCVQRNDSFRPDPALDPQDASQLGDYKGSGYDRGHLSPAADNKYSAAAMNDSFLLSNISPQPPRFNQGIWARLENLVRAWAMKNGGIWVTTGPVLENNLRAIGSSRVSVPNKYYKVLVTKSGKQTKALGLLLPTDANADLASYAVSIDDIEDETGLDFNQGLNNEDELERDIDVNGWGFRDSYSTPPCRRATPFEFAPEIFSAAY